jgi:hypothetical protein
MPRSVAEKHQSAHCRLKNISHVGRSSLDEAVLTQILPEFARLRFGLPHRPSPRLEVMECHPRLGGGLLKRWRLRESEQSSLPMQRSCFNQAEDFANRAA